MRAGKRRLHQKPNAREIAACRVWLDAELDFVEPEIVVALGATAAQALMGRGFRVTRQRGEVLAVPWTKAFLATVHPSSILRAPAADRDETFAALVRDLKVVAKLLRQRARPEAWSIQRKTVVRQTRLADERRPARTSSSVTGGK